MYFRLLRPVIEDAIALHIKATGQSYKKVYSQIYKRIDETSKEYWKAEPQIHYNDPACRIGYLHRQAAANATLFERALYHSDEARDIFKQSAQNTLNVLSMGGGPGTELLGLVKYYLRHPRMLPPRRIDFTVVDNILEWSGTWRKLAAATEHELRSVMAERDVEPTTISPMFLPFDALDQAQYAQIVEQCSMANLVVFNYVFSENKSRLGQSRQAVKQLAKLTSDNCLFVVIDRLEGDRKFNEELVDIFESAFDADIEYYTLGGNLDPDEDKADLGESLLKALKTPRLTFYTGHSRNDSVFWFEVKRS